MLPFSCSLFAALDVKEVIQIVVVFLIFVVPIISQLVKKVRQIPPPDQRPLPPRAAPVDVADEIEDFMRRAAGRQPARGQRQVAAPSPVVAEPVRAEVVAERPSGGQLGDQVKSHFSEYQFNRSESKLGKEVGQTGSELNQRLHQVFDHHVGKLEAAPDKAPGSPSIEPQKLAAAATEVPSLFTTGLFDLLSNPDSIRQAIVLNEVLQRPEERWE